MSAAPRIHLGDAQTASDVATFVRRARAVDDDGARLTVTPLAGDAGARLDVTVPVLTRAGLLDTGPEVFGVRSWSIRSADPVDAVYDHAALLDRLERGDGTEWPVPPSEVHKAWAGQSIPRSGWAEAGVLDGSALREGERAGSQEIADALPSDPGQAMLRQARRAVWGRPESSLGGLPLGVGFAAVRLGFVGRGPEGLEPREGVRPGLGAQPGGAAGADGPQHGQAAAAASLDRVRVFQQGGLVLVAMRFGVVVVRLAGAEAS
ncbi:hypothetical protein [Falsarthrobacter nasiphocae]|uniref:Uncharacterized protein n=1 Tax=Falsarthrobacter nasiphocae TaxID=189863 RepID=A0AAE3YGP9_9MICC|nr:hypothetical protein [Falsarthrobacter nasiphocae]MDR6892905.1 hypothetical protein [Falsarthrobacter nasiphocae]